jgi:hypothetical protein
MHYMFIFYFLLHLFVACFIIHCVVRIPFMRVICNITSSNFMLNFSNVISNVHNAVIFVIINM